MQGHGSDGPAVKPELTVTLTFTLTANGAPERLQPDVNLGVDGAEDLVQRVLAHEPEIRHFADGFRDAVLLSAGALALGPRASDIISVAMERYGR